MRGRPISRILSSGLPQMDDHSSDDAVTNAALAANPDLLGVKHPRPPCGRHAVPIWHCSRWGLPCRPCCHVRGGLLPHRFTFSCADTGSLHLCGAVPRVTPAGHYPAPCFVESGLSSTFTCRSHPAIRASAAYAERRGASTGKRSARSVAMCISTASSGPLCHGRNRMRTTSSNSASSTSG